MADLKFADTHNLVAFLSKLIESEGFEQIVDFLNANPIRYTLTINPTLYISCIEQFWSTVKAKTINGEVQLQDLVDGKKIIITELIVRRDLQLEDAEATNQKFNFSKYIFESMVKNLDNVGKFWMYPRFIQVFLDKQLEGMPTHNRIYIAPSHTKKIFGNMRRVGKGFSRRETPLFQTMVVQDQAEMGEGSANPTDPHHTPTFIQPSTSQPQKKQKPRKPKRKDTQIPQSSGPTEHVADEAVYKELDDSLVRAATTASSLEAEQDSGNIAKTQSKATPNESSSLGTTSGGGPRRQETMGDTIAQTRFENVSKHSNDPLLARGNTLRSGEDSLKLNELMELCTNLQTRVLDLEKTKTTQAKEIVSLKRRVKKLEQKKRSRTHGLKGDTCWVLQLGVESLILEIEKFSTCALKSVKPKVKANVVEEPSVPVSTASTKVSADMTTTTATIPTPRKGIVVTELGTSTTITTISSQHHSLGYEHYKLSDYMPEFDEGGKTCTEKMKQCSLTKNKMIFRGLGDADYQLAQRLQAKEQEQFTTEQKATLFKELLEQRRKHFAAKRVEEKRNKPPTKTQQKKTMITYLKNMEGWKHKDLKS
ncbi:hypothetical protein Tco_1395011 [Tanacetum coccineum]